MTEKQKKFVEEYLIDLNATQAAIRAGYSVKNAGKIGHELLEKTRISNEVTRKIAERSRRTGINADRVLIELAKIAFVNADDVIESKDATLKENASRDDLAAIQSIKVKTFGEDGVEREIKLADKLKALDMLGRHLGMWNDKLQVSGMEEEQKKLADILQQLRGDG
ncbi:MAG: terminase small subunit [Anaerobutyricum hallii]|uniref:terminase small subunit n=1 Tax=Anaerobutyricum hallii TaxID=39488 RepID=UPI0039914700